MNTIINNYMGEMKLSTKPGVSPVPERERHLPLDLVMMEASVVFQRI
jgi:hypothetical protein